VPQHERRRADPLGISRFLATRGDFKMHLVAIGGSDAGISAALRARELDPTCDVTVVVADAYPNFSICGIPYYVSGEVADWHDLAHRTHTDLEATGMKLRLDTLATAIDPAGHQLAITNKDGSEELLSYDGLIVGTGAVSVKPTIDGLSGTGALGVADGVHLLHSMGDTFELMTTLNRGARRAIVVGAGYIGLEMAEGLTTRGIMVTQIEQLPEVLPTVDPELGRLVHAELEAHGVEVLCNTAVRSVRRVDGDFALAVEAIMDDGTMVVREADVVLVVVGVRPDAALGISAGMTTGARGALSVDRGMRTNLPDVFAAGDCAVTYHRLLGDTYLPLGTTAHKQGRVAGENSLGGSRTFAGSVGTQVVKVFDLVIARTGLRDHEAESAGFAPVTVGSVADDHKAYYPGSQSISMRYTGDQVTGRLLGLQILGRLGSEIAKRVDVAASALFSELSVDEVSDFDLSYTPPLGSPWDALQAGAQTWSRNVRER
jgi:NADPH-dependent 2,4-dienoyl-CoA reductase/sulfur reductase-like enzyme